MTTTIAHDPICSPKRCSPASTSGRRCTTASTASSTRTSRSSGDRGYLNARGARRVRRRGLSFAEVQALQRRLAYVAPATALGGEHALLLDRRRRRPVGGRRPVVRVDARAPSADGAVFAAGHGEAGNDIPLLLSSSAGRTRRRRLGDHRPQDLRHALAGLDVPRRARDGHERPRRPRRSCTRFVPRDAERYRIEQTWDVLGMRATESNDTILDHTFVPDEHVALVCPAGFAGAGMFQVAIFAWGLLGFATVYAASRSAPTTRRSQDAPAHVGRADPVDGVPPGRAARGRRDAHRARGDRRLPRRTSSTTGRTASTTAWTGR